MTVKERNPQEVQFSPEIKQDIGNLNARITNVNLAINDLLREMDITFKAMTTLIAELQKENAYVKAKAEAPNGS